MSTYYSTVWTMFDETSQKSVFPEAYKFASGDHRQLLRGSLVEGWNSGNRALYRGERTMADCLIGLFEIHLVSKRAKITLEQELQNQVQFLPIVLESINSGRASAEEYFIMNMLFKIDCLDYERTDTLERTIPGEQAILMPGAVPVLKRDMIPQNMRVFLLANPLSCVFRDDVVEKILVSGLTGFIFEQLGS